MNSENVLVYGNGGREHCLAWALAQSSRVQQVHVYPGNGGCLGNKMVCANVSEENLSDFGMLYDYCIENSVSLIAVGPESPLCYGITDFFNLKNKLNNTNIHVFGPSHDAAMLERSKVFAKSFMTRHAIPTAPFNYFWDIDTAILYIQRRWGRNGKQYVVKANGLAGGKGVYLPDSADEAIEAITEILGEANRFGDEGSPVIIEKRLRGKEVSVLVLSDGTNGIILPPATDYKRSGDEDSGLNTGGMGAVCPTPYCSDTILEYVARNIISPTLQGMRSEGNPFVGCLYVGLIISDDLYTGSSKKVSGQLPHCGAINVLEYNVRFGDPETQAVLPLVCKEYDFYDIIAKTVSNNIVDIVPRDLEAKRFGNITILPLRHKLCAVTVVLASRGYPLNYETGKIVEGIGENYEGLEQDVELFHAGTRYINDKYFSSGGRVLSVSSIAPSFQDARKMAYLRMNSIVMDGAMYRSDIAKAF